MTGTDRESVFNYQHDQLKQLLGSLIREQVSDDAWAWITEKIKLSDQPSLFNTTFAAIPRKTGKHIITVTKIQQETITQLIPGFTINDWTLDRLARVWLLMNLQPTDKEKYFRTIENLFLAAEMNELVALYSALPVLAYPEMWVKRCAEGIRSNIGNVLEAIMYHNPYPAEYLPEPAWNQLVLKAFFTEKLITSIIGVDERSNQELANILSDYAHERWAAHRPVHPQLWRFLSKHLNDKLFPDLQKLASSENLIDKQAAAMVCHQTNYPRAKKLLEQSPDLQAALNKEKLTWSSL